MDIIQGRVLYKKTLQIKLSLTLIQLAVLYCAPKVWSCYGATIYYSEKCPLMVSNFWHLKLTDLNFRLYTLGL